VNPSALRKSIKSILAAPSSLWLALTASLVLCAPALFTGLQIDDLFHRAKLHPGGPSLEKYGSPDTIFDFAGGDPETTREIMDLGLFPWWTDPNLKLSFWRPVTEWTHKLDYALWPDTPFLMHIHSLLWWAALVLVLGRLYRRVIPTPWIAGLAVIIYAIDDAHAIPVAWVANRNAVIAAVFAFATLYGHDRWRRARRPIHAPLGFAALAAALLANEGAIAIGAYLFAYAMFLDPAGRPRALAALLPYAAIVALWRILYTAAGYGAAHSAAYIDPIRDPARFLGAVAERAPVLLLAQWFAPPAEPYTFLPPTAQTIIWLLGIAAILILAVMGRRWLPHSTQAAFFTTGMVLALIPACATFTADRLLLFVGFGASGLIALFVAAIAESTTTQRPARLFAWTLVVIHLVVAPIMLPARILAFAYVGNGITHAVRTAPLANETHRKDVIVMNAPNFLFAAYLTIIRETYGLTIPNHVRSLSPNSGIPVAIAFTREDAHTIAVRPDRGYPFILVRGYDNPFKPGDVVNLPGVEITVRSVTPKGHPLEVAFEFDHHLDDPRYVWLRSKGFQFEKAAPPPLGETVILSAPKTSNPPRPPF